MTTQAESIAPPTPEAATVAETQPAQPAEPVKPQIEVKGGESKELAERVKLRRELEAARKEANEYKSKYEKLQPWEERAANAKKKPLSFMREVGLEWDDLAQAAIRGEDPPAPEPTPVEKELAELKAKLAAQEEWRKQQEESVQAEQRRKSAEALAAYDNKVRSLLEEPGKFPYALASEESVDAVAATVVAVRNQHWANTVERDEQGRITKRGEVLSEEQALQKVEDYWRAKFQRAPGAKPAEQGQAPAAASKQSVQPAQQEPKPQPITNSLTPPATLPAGDKPKLSRDELLKRSIDELKAKRAAAKQQAAQH